MQQRIQCLGQFALFNPLYLRKSPKCPGLSWGLAAHLWDSTEPGGGVLAFLLPLFLGSENHSFLLFVCCIECVCVKSILRLAFPCNSMWSCLEWWVGVWISHCCCSCEGVPSLWAWILSAVSYALGCTGESHRECMQAICPASRTHRAWPMKQVCISGSKCDCELWAVV